jgi:hypothetical protein
MRYIIASLLTLTAAFAQSFPTINAYTLTEADCSPLSPLMLFRPPGFVCKPSANVVIAGMGAEVTSYDVRIMLQRQDGWVEYISVILPVANGEAHWTQEGIGKKVTWVSVQPQSPTQPPTTAVF